MSTPPKFFQLEFEVSELAKYHDAENAKHKSRESGDKYHADKEQLLAHRTKLFEERKARELREHQERRKRLHEELDRQEQSKKISKDKQTTSRVKTTKVPKPKEEKVQKPKKEKVLKDKRVPMCRKTPEQIYAEVQIEWAKKRAKLTSQSTTNN